LKGKTRTYRIKNALQPLPIPEYAFQLIGVDICGPFPVTENNNEYIIVFADHLTKYVIAAPIPDQKSTTIAEILIKDVIQQHGCPKELLSDRGTSFLSELISDINKIFEIKKISTTPYHPQTNGQVERFNHTLKTMLSMYVNDKQTNWDEYLSFVVFAYNTSVNKSTNYSPFVLLYGREPLYPIDIRLNYTFNYDTYENSDDYLNKLKQKLSYSTEIAKIFLEKSKENNKIEYENRKGKKLKLKEGDKVLVYTPNTKPGLSSKLTHHYIGPFQIIKKMSETNFLLKMKNKNQIINIDRLKLFIERVEEVTSEIEDNGEVKLNEKK